MFLPITPPSGNAIEMTDLPPFECLGEPVSSIHIAHYLQNLMGLQRAIKRKEFVLIPPMLVLNGLFHAPEEVIFEALFWLSRQGYDYEIHSIDTPIKLFVNKRPFRKTRELHYLHTEAC